MANLQFQKATKHRSKARVAIDGPTGAGKTYTALIAATVLAEGGRVAVIDTERGSASLYSDDFQFDVLELAEFNPRNYVEAIEAAEAAGYAVVVIDSLSHAWEGEGGALDLVDRAAKRSQSGNNYVAWKDVTPLQRKLVDAMLQSRCHIIATMRSKMDYVQEKDERTGKTAIRKVGMAPVQRQGMEYEFTVVADMDTDHNLVVTKSRCKVLADRIENKPNAKFWKIFLDWLNSGDAAASPVQPTEHQAAANARNDTPAAPSDQKPAERQYSQDEIGPAFDEPSAPAPAATPARPVTRPNQAMWDKWDDLTDEAKKLGVKVPLVNAATITSEGLALAGRELRAAVEKAKASPPPAANGNGHGPAKITREMLIARLSEVANEAKRRNLVGPAWAINPSWSDQQIIDAGRALNQKIADAKAKEPQHA